MKTNANFFRAVVVSTCASLFSASAAFAGEIVITDCQGTPRAVKQVDADRDQSVKITAVSVSGPVAEFTASLADVSGVTRQQVSASGGQFVFDAVASGTWKICGLPQNVSIDSVEIVALDEARDLRVASIVGGGLAATGLVLGSSGSGTSSGNSGLPGNGLSGEPSARLPEAELSTSTVSESAPATKPQSQRRPSAARPLAADEDCLSRTDAPELSPIS